MSAASATLAGRRAAEALMQDTCTIARPGTVTFLPDGTYSTGDGDTVYAGKCKVQQRAGRMPPTPSQEGTELVLVALEVHIPADVVGVSVNDLVTITASLLDPTLPGRVYRVVDEPGKSFATARRLRCEEIQ
jgi:hypothetical protein